MASARQRTEDLEGRLAKSESLRQAAERQLSTSKLRAMEARQAAETATSELNGLKAVLEETRLSNSQRISDLEKQVGAETASARRAQEELMALAVEIESVRSQMGAAVSRFEEEQAKWKEDREQTRQELLDEKEQRRNAESQLQQELRQAKLERLDAVQQLQALQQQLRPSEAEELRSHSARRVTPSERERLGPTKAPEDAADAGKAESKAPEVQDLNGEASKASTNSQEEPSKLDLTVEATDVRKAPSMDAADFERRMNEKARLRTELADLRRDLEQAGFTSKDIKAGLGPSFNAAFLVPSAHCRSFDFFCVARVLYVAETLRSPPC